MTATTIKDLFANDISRRIEEVIKVDQADEQIIRDELAELKSPDLVAALVRSLDKPDLRDPIRELLKRIDTPDARAALGQNGRAK